jgi:glutathionyl-hydroquinone reductase
MNEKQHHLWHNLLNGVYRAGIGRLRKAHDMADQVIAPVTPL